MSKILFNFYKTFLSPLFKFLFGGGCRFSPTCSEYFDESCQKFGFLRGSFLGTKRLLKCHPWGGSGFDPVPSKF